MPGSQASPRVAIVHDWLVGGGAELVVEQLHRMFPEAPIYTSYCTPAWRQRLGGQVRTGWLQPLGKIRKFIPFLRIWWFRRLDLTGYDLVISSSGAEAKGIKVPAGVTHINYCHAPTHYYWSRYDEYLNRPGFGIFDGMARLGLRLLVKPLRQWDFRAAQRPDVMVANSSHTQAAVKKYYRRDSIVIHPPVDISRFAAGADTGQRHGFLAGGRLTPYKRVDLAVQACSALDLPLTVFGTGPDLPRLRKLAGPSVTFTGRLADTDVVKQFVSAEAYLFCSLDDFGIVGIESLAAGTPVIAYQAGGALDYIVPGETGEFFAEQTPESLQAVLQKFSADHYVARQLTAKARQFSASAFTSQMQKVIADALQKH